MKPIPTAKAFRVCFPVGIPEGVFALLRSSHGRNKIAVTVPLRVSSSQRKTWIYWTLSKSVTMETKMEHKAPLFLTQFCVSCTNRRKLARQYESFIEKLL